MGWLLRSRFGEIAQARRASGSKITGGLRNSRRRQGFDGLL